MMRRRLSFAFFSALAFLVLLALIELGNWQVKRLHEKEALIASVNANIAADPVELAKIENIYAKNGDVDYRPVKVEGRFLHEGEAHYHNTHNGAVGWHIYTPLQLLDGRILFVNRGFVLDALKDPASRVEGQIEGTVTFSGLARNAPSNPPSSIIPEHNLSKNQFFWRDKATMIVHAGLSKDDTILPFFVDAGASATPSSGWPLGGITRISFPNNHLQYIITWYGLALALVGVYCTLVFQNYKNRKND